jgi:hypothetical protein
VNFGLLSLSAGSIRVSLLKSVPLMHTNARTSR